MLYQSSKWEQYLYTKSKPDFLINNLKNKILVPLKKHSKQDPVKKHNALDITAENNSPKKFLHTLTVIGFS